MMKATAFAGLLCGSLLSTHSAMAEDQPQDCTSDPLDPCEETVTTGEYYTNVVGVTGYWAWDLGALTFRNDPLYLEPVEWNAPVVSTCAGFGPGSISVAEGTILIGILAGCGLADGVTLGTATFICGATFVASYIDACED